MTMRNHVLHITHTIFANTGFAQQTCIQGEAAEFLPENCINYLYTTGPHPFKLSGLLSGRNTVRIGDYTFR